MFSIYCLGPTRKLKTKGQQFIEQHGEKIWIESEPGQGTTVSFTLLLA